MPACILPLPPRQENEINLRRAHPPVAYGVLSALCASRSVSRLYAWRPNCLLESFKRSMYQAGSSHVRSSPGLPSSPVVYRPCTRSLPRRFWGGRTAIPLLRAAAAQLDSTSQCRVHPSRLAGGFFHDGTRGPREKFGAAHQTMEAGMLSFFSGPTSITVLPFPSLVGLTTSHPALDSDGCLSRGGDAAAAASGGVAPARAGCPRFGNARR